MTQRGFSLVELVIFIVVISLSSMAIFQAFTTYLQTANSGINQGVCQSLAQARLELILANKRHNGYSNTTDPCTSGTPPAVCMSPVIGFNVSSTITTTTLDTDPGYSTIQVTATGPNNSRIDLLTLVSIYG